jgi:hypothetical protein
VVGQQNPTPLLENALRLLPHLGHVQLTQAGHARMRRRGSMQERMAGNYGDGRWKHAAIGTGAKIFSH